MFLILLLVPVGLCVGLILLVQSLFPPNKNISRLEQEMRSAQQERRARKPIPQKSRTKRPVKKTYKEYEPKKEVVRRTEPRKKVSTQENVPSKQYIPKHISPAHSVLIHTDKGLDSIKPQNLVKSKKQQSSKKGRAIPLPKYLTIDEFIQSRKQKDETYQLLNVKGAYILRNITKDRYYIGQSIDPFSRVMAHISGRGNGDVYADMKYGDEFRVEVLPLRHTRFYNLNQLERSLIAQYDAYKSGYNRTSGNRKKANAHEVYKSPEKAKRKLRQTNVS